MKIYITGISGTGKTTIVRELVQHDIPSISIDEVPGLCHWINKLDNTVVNYEAELNEAFINSHEWICDSSFLQRLVEKEENIVVAGMAFNQKEFIHLFDKVLLFHCDPTIFIGRIMNRKDNDFGKDASAQKIILNSYQRFEEEMLGDGAISVDVEKSIDQVVKEVLRHMK